MKHPIFTILPVFLIAAIVLVLLPAQAGAQSWELKGTVYDISQRKPLEAVTVLSTSGKGTLTDSLGHYRIRVTEKDSIYFSYQNRVTTKYPVAKFEDITQFNTALHVRTYSLPMVTIMPRDYRIDSLRNRREYEKYFGWEKPNPLNSINIGPTAVGMDPNVIINMFRFKRNRQLASLQQRLLQDEQDRYIDYRFSKKYVKELTHLEGDALNAFMKKYRPPYDFVLLTNDIELGYYIQQSYRKENGQLPSDVLIYQLGTIPQ